MDAEGSLRATVPQTNIIFTNMGNQKFADVTAGAGAALGRRGVHRGAAFGDLDNDGRVDVVLTNSTGRCESFATSVRPPITGCSFGP